VAAFAALILVIPVGCKIPVHLLPEGEVSSSLPLPKGEEEPGLKGAREGDTCLSPGAMQGWVSGKIKFSLFKKGT